MDDRISVDRFPPQFWIVFTLVLLTALYTVLQVGFVRPYLWPAGHGAVITGEVGSLRPFLPRPPDFNGLRPAGTVESVADGSPAALAGVRAGDVVESETIESGYRVALSGPLDLQDALERWRRAYGLGVSSPVTLEWLQRTTASGGPSGARPIHIPREAAWRTGATGWARQHLGAILQTVGFTIAAIVLLVLRSNDLTAQLSVAALALGGVAGGGPLMGVERAVPLGVGHLLTVLGWLGGPLGLPTVALAILYFPSPSPLLRRYPWIQAIPFVAAAPMIVPSAATGLYPRGRRRTA